MSIRQLNNHSGLTVLSFPKLSPRALLLSFLSLLFLVSVQLCYSMAHSSDATHQMPDHSVQQSMSDSASNNHSAPIKPVSHGAQLPVACGLMLCGAALNIGADFSPFSPIDEYGQPPLVGPLKAADRNNLLRPPIFLHN